MHILAATHRHDAWMRACLGDDLDQPALVARHAKMRESAFVFLRATYWRWAEGILDLLPDLADAPQVLAIGDTHLENFGTWRDGEGRLVWGANDFDDAAIMPWPLDLVRLAASALLARDRDGPRARTICAALAAGYAAGLADPHPIVLERDHPDLRQALILPDKARAKFWDRIDDLVPCPAPSALDQALRAALPEPGLPCQIVRRQAGTGSLGRPRFVARAHWRGGPLLREAKALLPPVWALAHRPEDPAIRTGQIAHGPHRAPDPHYQVTGAVVVRRLSPSARQIELGDALLLTPAMLDLMGRDIAHCHAAGPTGRAAIARDLATRDPDWLRRAAKSAAAWVAADQAAFAQADKPI